MNKETKIVLIAAVIVLITFLLVIYITINMHYELEIKKLELDNQRKLLQTQFLKKLTSTMYDDYASLYEACYGIDIDATPDYGPDF